MTFIYTQDLVDIRIYYIKLKLQPLRDEFYFVFSRVLTMCLFIIFILI